MIDVARWRMLVLETCREMPALLPHSAVAALRARDYATRLDLPADDQDLCEVAALTHDIGKTPALNQLGFHPLDGAAYALARGEPRLAGLIAHHSGARYEAAILGLTIPYPHETSVVQRIITVVDGTTTQQGIVVSICERQRDVIARHGATSVAAKAMDLFRSELEDAVRQLEPSLL